MEEFERVWESLAKLIADLLHSTAIYVAVTGAVTWNRAYLIPLNELLSILQGLGDLDRFQRDGVARGRPGAGAGSTPSCSRHRARGDHCPHIPEKRFLPLKATETTTERLIRALSRGVEVKVGALSLPDRPSTWGVGGSNLNLLFFCESGAAQQIGRHHLVPTAVLLMEQYRIPTPPTPTRLLHGGVVTSRRRSNVLVW